MHKYLFLLVVFSRLIGNDISDEAIFLLEDEILSQFEKKGGTGPDTLEDGILTGVAVWDAPNTFLCAKENYGDFILTYSTKIDPRLNSGLHIRAQAFMDENDCEMLRGYQVEIDPSTRAWSGGIHEEIGRVWIGNLCNNTLGRQAFRNDEWNHLRCILLLKEIPSSIG